MPRVCTICSHGERKRIDGALVEGMALRGIARTFRVSEDALARHRDHIPGEMVKAKDAADVAAADNLLAQLQALRNKAMALLLKAEAAGDYRTVLTGVREARACLEVLLEVEGELDRRPQVTIITNPQWIELRSVILLALQTHPEARQAVVRALGKVDANAAA